MLWIIPYCPKAAILGCGTYHTCVLQSLVRSSTLLLIIKHGDIHRFPFYFSKCTHPFLNTTVIPLHFDPLSWVGKNEWESQLGSWEMPLTWVCPWELGEQITIIHPLCSGQSDLTNSILELYCLRGLLCGQTPLWSHLLIITVAFYSVFLALVQSPWRAFAHLISGMVYQWLFIKKINWH